jgi:hypothetical protein
MSWLLFCLCFTIPVGLSAQKSTPAGLLTTEARTKIQAIEDTMTVLAYMTVNDSLEQSRFAACKRLITTLVRALKTENSFKYPFERLNTVSVMYPPDSTFRIFTWQLFVNDSVYKYYGAIQRNNSQLDLVPLIDRSADLEEADVPYAILTPDRWYGALYYNIRQFDTKQGRQYMLFGLDAYSFFNRRKVIDILQFGKDGKPGFGAPVFNRTASQAGQPNQRLILEYSAEATIRCNWDEQYQMVLFDHLISMPSPFGRGMTWVPDGSYDGLKWEKGRWQYIEKVFNDVMEEAPTVVPVLDGDKQRDITGRPKKQKKPKP